MDERGKKLKNGKMTVDLNKQSSHQFSIWVQSGLLFLRHDICILLKGAYAALTRNLDLPGVFKVSFAYFCEVEVGTLKTLTRSHMVTWQRNILAPMVLRFLCYCCNIFTFFSEVIYTFMYNYRFAGHPDTSSPLKQRIASLTKENDNIWSLYLCNFS